jgi:hypothetical protein
LPNENEFQTFDNLYSKFEEKLHKKVEYIQMSIDDVENDDQQNEHFRNVAKAKHYVDILGEINLKRKLTHKRCLNLSLILCKHVKCNVENPDDGFIKTLIEVVKPSLASEDTDLKLLALEVIGQICSLKEEQFFNYTQIYSTILNEGLNPLETIDDEQMIFLIVSLKSVFDGLIFFRGKQSQDLEQTITQQFIFHKN